MIPTRTKIICTMGPSVDHPEMIEKLIATGMNVARLNFSHGTHEGHLGTIQRLKAAREKLQIPLAIMLDTKGPEIRLGKLKDQAIPLEAGHKWLLVGQQVEGDRSRVTLTPAVVLEELKVGMALLFDDGYITAKVIERTSEGVLIEIQNAGTIKSGKGVNIPNSHIKLPAVTEKDIEDIRFGCRNEVNWIAASFIRSAEHVREIKNILAQEGRPDILVIAKIENREGIENFDDIVEASDGIMIARGDLGVEIPLSQVPVLQKSMIRTCYLAGKPAITATQMLESMIQHPRPTRAEVSDVANAIYDSTSAVMLSAETAVGKYPLETVNMMKGIICTAEDDFDYRHFFSYYASLVYHDIPPAVCLASVKAAYSSNAKAIFTFTNSGMTARLISRLRPSIPIIATTWNPMTYHQMACNWGLIPFLAKECSDLANAFKAAGDFAVRQGIAQEGDLVVVTSGSPFGTRGTTNLMLMQKIGQEL